MALNKDGHEVLDTTPLALPVGWKPPMTLQEQIRYYIRRELSEVAAAEGEETFEEADDFDVDDEDPELRSQYELDAESESLGRWREDEQRRLAVEAAERRIVSRGAGSVGSAPVGSVEPDGGSAPEGRVPSSDSDGARGGAREEPARERRRSVGAAGSGGTGSRR